jgi:hypothetical protein
MRSFLSTFFFGLFLALLSLSNDGVVDARINTPGDVTAVPMKSPMQIGTEKAHRPQGIESSLLEAPIVAETIRGMGVLLQGRGHRSLGGGRSLAQQPSWARDDEGNILWWVWLIIGLSCFMCCLVCCCASACCLRD